MPQKNKAVRGTADVLPYDSYKWQYVENKMIEISHLFGFKEIRVPVFEHTEVFTRSVGETTDVVQKEMYTFDDKGGRSITLRPEFTAGVVRSVIEHGLINETLPLKVCYIGACYRYEKPQAGRYREFHQYGVECIGAPAPSADAEVIALAKYVLESLDISDLRLELNSIGCPECRPKYQAALKEYFKSNEDQLCKTCIDRLDRNPLRILDCKSEICSALANNAPVVLDFLCDDCKSHFEGVKKHLDAMGIEYIINPRIVRGLDYYTRTVFEFIAEEIGAQSTVCGGGRYDGLIEQMGGPSVPALGFAMGIERLLLVMESRKAAFPIPKSCQVYIAPIGERAAVYASKLCGLLRAEGFSAATDLTGRSVKAQMKYADKLGALYTLVIGDNELESKTAVLKDMNSGKQITVNLPDGLITAIYDQTIDNAMNDLTESIEKMEGLFNIKD